MTRDCGHSAGDDQRLHTCAVGTRLAHRSQRGKTVQRWSEEQVRPCRREQLSGRPGILTWWRQKYQ
ncbi:unnamed protein product, partial [Staurois parvus]